MKKPCHANVIADIRFSYMFFLRSLAQQRDAVFFSECLPVRLSVRQPEPFVRFAFAVAVTPMMAPGSVRPDLRIACAALSEHRVARRQVALRALKLRL